MSASLVSASSNGFIIGGSDGFIIASLVEAVLLVLVLALFLLRIRTRLNDIAGQLAAVDGGLQGIERVVALIAWGAENLNAPLRVIVGALPDLVKNATTVVRGG